MCVCVCDVCVRTCVCVCVCVMQVCRCAVVDVHMCVVQCICACVYSVVSICTYGACPPSAMRTILSPVVFLIINKTGRRDCHQEDGIATFCIVRHPETCTRNCNSLDYACTQIFEWTVTVCVT